MRLYGIVSAQFWIGQTGRSLRGHPEAQLLALYLMSCPTANMVGLFYLPKLFMAYETGLDAEEVEKGLARLIRDGFCSYDEEREIVWVREMGRFQVGEELSPRDKRRPSIVKQIRAWRSSPLFLLFLARYGAAWSLKELKEQAPAADPETGSRERRRSPSEETEDEPCTTDAATSEEVRDPEQEQEQGQEENQEHQRSEIEGACPAAAEETRPTGENHAPRESGKTGVGKAEKSRTRSADLDSVFDAHDLGIRILAEATDKSLRPRNRSPARRQAVADVIRSSGLDCARLAARNLVLSGHHRDNGYLDIDYAMRRPERYAELFDGPDEDLAEALAHRLHVAATAPGRPGELPGRLGIAPLKDTRRKLVI